MADAVHKAANEYATKIATLPIGQFPIGDIHGLALYEAAKRLRNLSKGVDR
jgi:hypothetical protein